MPKVRVRIAPSPTGIPHIGNTRTVLFNWLYAQKNNGDFIVRVEDTDRQRFVEGALEKILEILEFLGLNWNEGPKIGGEFGPYIQSERKDIYKKYTDELIKKGAAYEDEGAIRFKVEKGKEWKWDDLIHGEISFKSDVIEDFIILKSDGFPTYHLAVVIDDHLMEISDVLRGDEWIPSTPKHLMLYEAFGWKPPSFGHLPVIVGADKSKLSKRHGAKSVLDYKNDGYIAEALINFMALMGWSPKDEQEFFTLHELIQKFDIKAINTTSPIFNIDKLNWFNGQWIRRLSVRDLAKRIADKYPEYDEEEIVKVLPIVKDRMITLNDFKNIAGLFFVEKPDLKDHIGDIAITKKTLGEVVTRLSDLKVWDGNNISATVQEIMDKEQLTKAQMYRSLGVALSGTLITPPIFPSMEIIGQAGTVSRLEEAKEKLK